VAQPGQVAGRLDLAVPSGADQGAQKDGSASGRQRGLFGGHIEHQRQLGWSAESGDERLSALVTLGGNASGLKERKQWREDVGSADRLKGKQQALRRTFKVEPAGPHLG
jgi:hypothetical protein